MSYLAETNINIVALQGSIRPNNYTGKALSVVEQAAKRIPGLNLEVVDPAGLDLSLPGAGETRDGEDLRQKVKQADGVILATPEYHGSYSSVMKLMIDNLGFPSALKDKPVALLGVAAGRIGAIKALEHLRGVASHTGAYVLPQAVSIANVRDRFGESNYTTDAQTSALIKSALDNLIKYLSTTHTSAAQICALSRN